jgi:hypothetical protein
MASNLGCIGLQPESEDGLLTLLNAVEGSMRPLGRTDQGAEVLQWTDDSGARLTLTVSGDDIVDLVPSYAGPTGVSLAGATRHGDFVAADVLDGDGELTTRLLCELEQRAFLPADGASGAAALTAFGLDVAVHPSEAAFTASDDSLLTPRESAGAAASGAGAARLAPESFISLGLFGTAGSQGDAEPYARLSGRVTSTGTRTNSRTGQRFHAVGVQSIGMRLTVCLAATDHPTPPASGSVVSGIVYLAASMPSLWPSAQRDRPTTRR